MRLSRPVVIFISILAIATTLRFWQLGKVPASVDWDEAALGYNAYSLLKTGKDEFGIRFPLVIRSFDDYKPPLYTYITVPSVALFGLSPWSTRLPSAIFGVFAVIGTFFLAREMLVLARIKDRNDTLALVAMGLLAISPWHLQFSRIAFEANTGVTINIWAVFMFLKGIRMKSRWIYVSAVLFGLSVYSYHSERLFIPLIILSLGIIFRKELFSMKKLFIGFVIIGLIVVFPAIPVFIDPTTLMRLRGTSSLADQTGLLARTVQRLTYDKSIGDPVGVIFDNRRLVWVKTLFSGYISHYSLSWLFLTGDNPRHHAPDMGLLYIWELPFVLAGIFWVARRGGKMAYILFCWFVIAPIAASPTTELPHAIRTLVFLPTFQLFSAFGLYSFYLKARTIRFGIILRALVCICIVGNFIYYFHMYFYHMDREYSQYWQYGYREAVAYAQAHKGLYKHIVVSTKLEQPYMFFLFYSRYDPVKYILSGGTASGGFAEVKNRFDVYEFRPIVWEHENRDGNTLYIGKPSEITGSGLETITYLNGDDAIKIASK